MNGHTFASMSIHPTIFAFCWISLATKIPQMNDLLIHPVTDPDSIGKQIIEASCLRQSSGKGPDSLLQYYRTCIFTW